MKPWLLLLTPHNCLLAHLKEIDERRISFHQLSGLTRKRPRCYKWSRQSHQSDNTCRSKFHHTHIFQNDVTDTLVFRPVHHQLFQVGLSKRHSSVLIAVQDESPALNTQSQVQTTDAHLYSGVYFINVWDAAKDGLNLFLCQDGASDLPFFLQWIFEKLK